MRLDSTEMVDRLAGGHFIELLVANLNEVTEQTLATGKQGSVTVTLKTTTPDRNAIDPIVTISTAMKSNLPVQDAVVTGFYHYDGEFHREPAAQHSFLGVVDMPIEAEGE